MHRRVPVLALVVTAVALAGCRTPVSQSLRPAPLTTFAVHEAGFSPEQLAQIDDNCPLGVPQKDPGFAFPPTAFVIRDGYVLEHSSVDKIALWVCEHVTLAEITSKPGVKRRDKFAPDPQLDPQERAELADYRRSGFDRGHQAPAGDQSSSQQLKDETFFLSNMAPQIGSGFNRNVWAIWSPPSATG